MPTYEYRCPEGHDFEKFVQKISDAKGELPCPTCGKVAARRMSAGGGLLFKGSGFYITDYGKDGKKDQRAAAKPESSGGEAAKPASDAGAASPAATATPAKASPEAKPAASAKKDTSKAKPGPAT